jgi:putrescine aminotransferase
VYEKITGKGLLIGQHFRTPELGYKVAAELFKRGLLVAGTLTSAQTIRIEPPLIITQAEIDEGLNRLNDAVGVVAKTM